MEHQNVTLSVPKALLKSSKILAISRDQSLSEFFRETLEYRMREAEGYNKSKNRQLRLLGKGVEMGTKGKIKIKREELHERGYKY